MFERTLAKPVVLENDQERIAIGCAVGKNAVYVRGDELTPVLDPVAKLEIYVRKEDVKSIT